jgi:hypothetical protein
LALGHQWAAIGSDYRPSLGSGSLANHQQPAVPNIGDSDRHRGDLDTPQQLNQLSSRESPQSLYQSDTH